MLFRSHDELDGSLWAQVAHQHLGGVPPVVDLAAERTLADVLLAATAGGLVHSAHDLSDGGLAVALADAMLRHGVGVVASVDGVTTRDGIDGFTALFSESGARALVSVSDEDAPALEALCAEHEQSALRIGRSGGEDLTVDGLFSIPVDELRRSHVGVISRALRS